MKFNAPDHFSHSFELKLENLPTKKSDRIALSILYPGLFFGAVLVVLGVYEFLNGFREGSSAFDISGDEMISVEPLMEPWVFDAGIVALGLWIVTSLIFSYIRYKKIFLNKDSVEIVYRPVFGSKQRVKEKLKNYEGVRFRIEFFQFGFLNKNKYIIELYHKNKNKIAPLYISTSDKKIRKMWEYYAKGLNLPALIMTDEGMVTRKVEDLDKSLRDLAQDGLIESKYDDRTPLPPSLALVRKRDKTVIKSRKFVWDAYNFISWIGVALLGIFLICSALSDEFGLSISNKYWQYGFYGLGMIIIVLAVWILCKKDKIVIKPHKVIIVHKFMLFSHKNNEINKDDIESVDVSFDPSTERYFVTISSDCKTMVFGKKLPIDDLRWVKAFLIHDIIRK